MNREMERAQTTDKLRTTQESEQPVGYSSTTAYDPSVARQVGRSNNTRGTKGRGINFKLIADVLEREADTPDGFDLAGSIIEALKGNKLDEKTKLLAKLELLQYVEPKKKAIEHKGKVELDAQTVDARLKYLFEKMGAPGGDQSGPAV